ncbi:Mu transposase C-terminal domain-containing protein [Aquicoccus sp. G2-2]|uniref:Mu transposase C-terminal domain-containing protein n=1 Tax=Aquicoccus sp. G2-2 TaxID=3092120 RepID=UPI002ADF0147|nr:Mu transposase C-terminal domain-containing protein [Aquicoccus sp. G2-2]MEA1112563.1 Mu transposase C-terminal domain-containing protein [Aquicoccus sp. G2-2]
MDEQKIDLMSLMEDSGLLQMMSDEEKARLGLDGSIKRWWMTVLLDVRTRCILGMILSRTPSSKSGLRAVEMGMRDKGVWAGAAGAQDAWAEHGLMGTLVTDCGRQFVGHDFRARLCDLGITLIHCPGARPWLKPYIERVFRTISSQLMPRLSGGTFGDILRKGSSNPEEKAALTVDELCTVLVRWIVDVYHNEPHEGLYGETPRDCWNRLTLQYGVTPPPSLRRRRLIFGEKLSRTLQKGGLTVAGVRYHSEALATHMLHSPDLKMEIRYYPEDISAIWVKIGTQWTEAPAVHRCFHGVSYQKWRMAHRELRAKHAKAAELKSRVVQQALDYIENLNADAMAKVGLVLDTIDAETIDRHEREAFIGFRVDDGCDEETSQNSLGDFGTSLPTAGDTAGVHANEAPRGPAEEISSVPSESIQFSDRQPANDDDDGEDDNFILQLKDK